MFRCFEHFLFFLFECPYTIRTLCALCLNVLAQSCRMHEQCASKKKKRIPFANLLCNLPVTETYCGSVIHMKRKAILFISRYFISPNLLSLLFTLSTEFNAQEHCTFDTIFSFFFFRFTVYHKQNVDMLWLCQKYFYFLLSPYLLFVSHLKYATGSGVQSGQR